MKFQTLEDANGFYNRHALLNGFVAKQGSNYRRKKFDVECNQSGKSTLTQDPKKKKDINALEKTNCEAKKSFLKAPQRSRIRSNKVIKILGE